MQTWQMTGNPMVVMPFKKQSIQHHFIEILNLCFAEDYLQGFLHFPNWHYKSSEHYTEDI